MHEIWAKTFFNERFMCAPSFLVCAHLTTCVHAHSLEGTLPADLYSAVTTSLHAIFFPHILFGGSEQHTVGALNCPSESNDDGTLVELRFSMAALWSSIF